MHDTAARCNSNTSYVLELHHLIPIPTVFPRHRLRDDERKAPAVVQYLNAENDHTRAVMADTEKLQVAAPTCT